MKTLIINNTENLPDLSNFEVTEDIEINFIARITDESIFYPIKILHKIPNLSLKFHVKLALFSKANIKMPVEIIVEKGAINTATNFKATVFLMDKYAKAEITPGLFIHEKNILNAGHGVIIKNVKPKDTFYIQSRGIDFNKARDLIIGF